MKKINKYDQKCGCPANDMTCQANGTCLKPSKDIPTPVTEDTD